MEQTSPAKRGFALFVHGYMDDSAAWRDTLAAMPAESVEPWEFAALDLELQTSEAPTSDLLLEGFAEQVVAFARRQAAGRDIVLIGHSMGGAIVELAAELLGSRVKALVLVTPAPLAGSPLPPEVMQRFESRLGSTNVEAIRTGRMAMSRSLPDPGLEVLIASSLRTGKAQGWQQLKAWTGGHRAGREPSTFHGPVLVVATDDRFFTHAALQEAALRFRTASVAHIAGAGHWAHLEKPQALAAHIAGFLQPLGAAS